MRGTTPRTPRCDPLAGARRTPDRPRAYVLQLGLGSVLASLDDVRLELGGRIDDLEPRLELEHAELQLSLTVTAGDLWLAVLTAMAAVTGAGYVVETLQARLAGGGGRPARVVGLERSLSKGMFRYMPTRDRHQPEVVQEHGLGFRQLRSPEQLRALAHPRRLELTDLLMTRGPMTASECAVALGDSAASCSYHLRQLARYGFVEEADGGHGRNRPWRYVPLGNMIRRGGTPAEDAAAEVLASVIDSRNLNRIRRYHERQSADPWRDAAASSDWAVRLTEDELRDLGESITALVAPLQQRTFAGEAPEGSRVVDVLTFLLPRPDEALPDRSAGPATTTTATTNDGARDA